MTTYTDENTQLDAPPAMPQRALALRKNAMSQLADRYSIDPSRLGEVLRNTVLKPTERHTPTSEEVAAFVVVANQYQLNPFTREIHAFVDPHKGVVPIVGVDGWCKIVNEHEQFDGCDFEEVEDDAGRPLKTTCVMYVKGRAHPIRVTERFAECRRNSPPWNTMPFRMLRHKAFMQAARLAFSISGLYDEDEARDVLRNAGSVVESDQTPKLGVAALKSRINSSTQSSASESGGGSSSPPPIPEPAAQSVPSDDQLPSAAASSSEPAGRDTPAPQQAAPDAGSARGKRQQKRPETPASDTATRDADAYAKWSAWLEEAGAQAHETNGMPPTAFAEAMVRALVACGMKGKGEQTTKAWRDGVLQAIAENRGHFAWQAAGE